MTAQESLEPISEGLRIPAETLLPPPDIVSGVVDVVGVAMHKDVALVVVAAGCFFIGAIISCLMPEVSGSYRRRTILSAPLSFLLTAPLWFTLLSGDLIRTSIAPIDSFLSFAMGNGGMRAQMFAFGVVMVMGLLSAPILVFITSVMQKILVFADKKTSGDNQPNI